METEAVKSLDVPVTHRMLLETETKLCARMDSKFDQVNSQLKKLEEMFHQALLLLEEQNSRNIYALDKLNFHSDRVDKLEVAVVELQEK